MTQTISIAFRSLFDHLRATLSPVRQSQADRHEPADDRDRLPRDEAFYWGWCMNGHW